MFLKKEDLFQENNMTKLIPKLQGGNYIIRKGDNLSTIAQTYKVNTSDLMKANGITDANTIRIGQQLKIPKPNETSIPIELSEEDKIKLLRNKGYDVSNWDSAGQNAWKDYNVYNKGTKCDPTKGCAWHVNNVNQAAGGKRYGHAWTALKHIKDSGGEVKFNVYEGRTFRNVDEVKKFSEANQNKVDYKKLKIGDQVGLYYPTSDSFDEAFKEGLVNGVGTPNTHTGYVSDIIDGVPQVKHWIHGVEHTQPWKQTRVMWVADPFPYHKPTMWNSFKDFIGWK